jgi:SAM-dependent methyltransferase
LSEASYRWNNTDAVVAYDSGAPVIHPRYLEVQTAVLAALPFAAGHPFRIVDLGGGSGRLLQRLLAAFPSAFASLIDQSEPFLALARDHLAQFDGRVAFLQLRLQDDWEKAVAPVDGIVSTSAIHHLEPAEKRKLYGRCYTALNPGGVFINGDEYRPSSDSEYLALLEKWGRHMEAALATGAIPESFGHIVAAWTKRNISEFDRPRTSGDDCHETVEAQIQALRQAGFRRAALTWQKDLWGVLVAQK